MFTAFEVFPNPNDGHFTLTLQGEAIPNLEISLINVLGQVLEMEQISFSGNLVKQYNQAHLASGTYIIQLKSESATAYRKLVVE